MTHAKLSLGCAVWAYRPWVGEFYPHGTRPDQMLERYVERLTCVEGNTTFYALPSQEVVEKWAEVMPGGFHFLPKLSRRITHESDLTQAGALTEHFLERMTHFGEALGPVLVQLPPHFGPHRFEELKRYIRSWPHDAHRMALEVRHAGWWEAAPEQALCEFMQEHGVGRVLLDTRPIYSGEDNPQALSERKKPELPVHPSLTADFSLVRFIQHPDPERNDAYMDQWVKKVALWLEQGTTVYFFSHCPVEDHSPAFARDFHRRLQAVGAPVGALPWDAVKDPPKQLGLF